MGTWWGYVICPAIDWFRTNKHWEFDQAKLGFEPQKHPKTKNSWGSTNQTTKIWFDNTGFDQPK